MKMIRVKLYGYLAVTYLKKNNTGSLNMSTYKFSLLYCQFRTMSPIIQTV